MGDATLKRSLNLPLLTLYGLGTILGAGIYVLVGKVAGVAGMYAPIAFVVSALLATFTGLSYAELSARYPRSAGEAVYISQAFASQSLARIIGWMVILTGVVSAATISNGFAGYLAVFIPIPDYLAISLLVVVIAALACWGIAESVGVAALITSVEIIGLFLVLWALGDNFSRLPQQLDHFIPPLEGGIWMSIFLGAFLAFYAFIGFEDMVNVAEEVAQPQRTIPMAIILALLIASVLYFLISLAALLSLPLDDLVATDSPMVTLLEQHHPTIAKALGVISLVAVVNGALVQMIMGARVLYGMSGQGLAPALFGQIATLTRTPVVATLCVAAVIWLMAIAFPLVTLAKLTSFIILAVFALVNLALVIIQRKYPLNNDNGEKSFQVHRSIPIIGGLLCCALLLLQVSSLIGGGPAASH